MPSPTPSEFVTPEVELTRWPAGVVGFTALYLAAATIAAFVSGNGEFLFYIGAMLVLAAAVAAAHRRVGFMPAVL